MEPGPPLVTLRELVGVTVGKDKWPTVLRGAHHVNTRLETHLPVLCVDLAFGGGYCPLPFVQIDIAVTVGIEASNERGTIFLPFS